MEIEAATSLFFFSRQGMIQELLHQLKYKGHQELGDIFGELLGKKIQKDLPERMFDFVVPIPLHPRKIKKKGI